MFEVAWYAGCCGFSIRREFYVGNGFILLLPVFSVKAFRESHRRFVQIFMTYYFPVSKATVLETEAASTRFSFILTKTFPIHMTSQSHPIKLHA